MQEISNVVKLTAKDMQAQGTAAKILKRNYENILAVHQLLSHYMALATKALKVRDLGDIHRPSADPISAKLQTIASKINDRTPSSLYEKEELEKALKQLRNKPNINASPAIEGNLQNIEKAMKGLPKLDCEEATGNNLDLVRKLAKAQVFEEALETVLGYINRLAEDGCKFKLGITAQNCEPRLIEEDFELGRGFQNKAAGKILVLTDHLNLEKQPDFLYYVTRNGYIFKTKSYNVVHSAKDLWHKDLYERLEPESKEYRTVAAQVLRIEDTHLTDDNDFKEIAATVRQTIVNRALSGRY